MPIPNISSYTPEELDKGREYIKEFDPATIQNLYLTGKISLRDKAEMLQAHGKISRELQVRQYAGAPTGLKSAAEGEIKTTFINVANEFKATWDAAKDAKRKTAIFHGIMGALETLRIYDIPGNVAERWALEQGLEPGYARALNWAIWIPTQFVGLSAILKAPFKAVGATVRGARAGVEATKDFAAYLKDPVGHAIKQSMSIDAQTLLKTTSAAVKTEAKQAAGTVVAASAVKESAEAAAEVTPQVLEQGLKAQLLAHYEDRASKLIRHGISHEQTQVESTAVRLSDILRRPVGKGISAAELEHLGKVNDAIKTGLEKSIKDAIPHMDEITAGTRPDLLGNFKAHLEAFAETNPKFIGTSGEVGRGLEYMKALQPEIQAARYYDNVLKGLGAEKLAQGSDAALAESLQKLSLMTDGAREVLLTAGAESSGPSIFHSLYKTLLFLNPGTHIVNTFGTMAHGIGKTIEYTGSALVPFKGTESPTIREAMAHWAGLTNSLGQIPRILRQAIEKSGKGFDKLGLEGAKDAIARYGTGRLLGIEDELVGGMFESAYVQSKILRQGLDKGYTGTALREFVDGALSNPKIVSDVAEESAQAVGSIMMHDQLGWTKGLVEWIRNSPVDYLMPVVRFPINAWKAGRDWTPGLQFISKKFLDDVAAGGAREAAARTRVTLSWMMGQYIWAQAKAGVITGGGPRNAATNKIWREAGNEPYSINGYSYNWLEPFRMPIGAIADMAQLSNEADPTKLEDFATAATLSIYRSIENNYFLRIMEGLTGAMGDIKNTKSALDLVYAGFKVLGAPIKTVIQGGPLGRRVGEMVNPEQADYNFYGELEDLANYITAGTPWGKDSRPKLDLDGNPTITPPVLGSRWASFFLPPIRPKNGPVSRTAELLDKWGVKVDDDWKTGPGQTNPDQPLLGPGLGAIRPNFTGDEAYDWKVLSLQHARREGWRSDQQDKPEGERGLTWLEKLNQLDQDPNFLGLSDAKKQQKVSALYNRYQHEGLKLLQQANPTVDQKIKDANEMTRIRRGKLPTTADITGGVEEMEDMPVQFIPLEGEGSAAE